MRRVLLKPVTRDNTNDDCMSDNKYWLGARSGKMKVAAMTIERNWRSERSDVRINDLVQSVEHDPGQIDRWVAG